MLLTKREAKMAGLVKFVFLRQFMDWDEVEVLKRKKKNNNKNEANIQPSWPNKLGQ